MNERSLDHRIRCSNSARRPSRVSSPSPGPGQPAPATPTRSLLKAHRPASRRRAGRRFPCRPSRRSRPRPPRRRPVGRSAVAGNRRAAPGVRVSRALTRGLYGGPLWLDMQGLQWPYVPQSGVGISRLWLGRRQLPADSQRKPQHLAEVHRAASIRAASSCGSRRRTRTAVGSCRLQAEIVANTTSTTSQPAPGVVSADDVWVRTGGSRTPGRSRSDGSRPSTSIRWDGAGAQHLRTIGRLRSRVHRKPQRVRRRAALYGADYLLYRPAAPKVGDVALHLYQIRPLRIELLGQFGNDGTENYLGAGRRLIFDIGWLKLRGARVPVRVCARTLPRRQEHHQEPR